MKTSAQGKPGLKTAHAAFSITEVLVAISIVGVLFLSLYGGITSGFAVVNLARENLRANQIVLEKMETIRLYTWDQINSNGFIAPTFTASFYPPLPVEGDGTGSNTDSTSTEDMGLIYYGTVAITNAPVSPAYSDQMKLVIVTLTWTNGNVPRQRQMQTLISEYGMQNYIY